MEEVADMKVKCTADIGTAVVTSDGAPRMHFKVQVTESCARIHRINKVKLALRADKEVITAKWRKYLCDERGRLTRKRLLEVYNVQGDEGKQAAAGPDDGEPHVNKACREWLNVTHGSVVRYAKEYIPKLGDTPINECPIQ